MKNLQMQLAVVLLFTLCLLTGAYGQITPSQDAYTNSVDPTTNYGTAVTLGVVSSATSIQSTYIQFDLSSIPAGYTSANIAKATLKLYVNAVTTAGSFNVDYVNGTWTEKTIKASLAPALGGTIVASVPLTSSNVHDYVLIDVTSALGAWLNGTQTNDGIALVANSPLSATIDSKESTSQSHPAELDVVFNGAITGITTASGSGLTGGGTSGTLNLSLTGCAANQVLKYNGTSWACAATGTGTITGVTAGTDLTGGGTSGNVTLNLNTAATNALYAQLGAANTFAANQTVDGTITASSSGTTIYGITSSTSLAGVEVLGGLNGVYAWRVRRSGVARWLWRGGPKFRHHGERGGRVRNDAVDRRLWRLWHGRRLRRLWQRHLRRLGQRERRRLWHGRRLWGCCQELCLWRLRHRRPWRLGRDGTCERHERGCALQWRRVG